MSQALIMNLLNTNLAGKIVHERVGMFTYKKAVFKLFMLTSQIFEFDLITNESKQL